MKETTEASYVERIDRITRYLSQELESTPSLRDLAETAGISPFHFHRVYRAITGETPLGTWRRLRLARAAVLLKETHKADYRDRLRGRV